MGSSVRIVKEKETDLMVFYRFGLADDGLVGRLSVRKLDGYVEEILPVLHPKGRTIFACAMHQVLEHWGRGEYPDITYWQASEAMQ